MFIRYDPAAISDEDDPEVGQGEGYREFLFFGDVESDYRAKGEEEVGADGKEGAARMNRAIWEEGARGWDDGRLAGIFVSLESTCKSELRLISDRMLVRFSASGSLDVRPHHSSRSVSRAENPRIIGEKAKARIVSEVDGRLAEVKATAGRSQGVCHPYQGVFGPSRFGQERPRTYNVRIRSIRRAGTIGGKVYGGESRRSYMSVKSLRLNCGQ